MKGREFEPETVKVLRLAAERGCSAYDCEFVDTALSMRVPLYTSDRSLAKAFPETANKNRNSGLTSPPSRSTVMQR